MVTGNFWIDLLILVCKFITVTFVMKCLIIGSEFNFGLWWKYGKHYTRWYDNRPQFDPEKDIPPPKEPMDEALDMLENVVEKAKRKAYREFKKEKY